ncbi:replication protein C, IncQ-type [Burkholderia pseudomallei]|uniref:replication protein C, IncQ-type n=1 Tax=Burkholderia pseudomallei TaxID=28450 RepID=UPI00051532FE|nr:replication protein C, IncQ-type [Burkholderia pseudomallei]AIS86522.1 replication C family protein [Burkholderia pseudomallei NAU35A-3]MBM5692838.1 replication protein [Burkholderia pseudomallei]
MTRTSPTHAKLAQPIVHAPGLFHSLAPGERKRDKLDVTHVAGDTTVSFVGFEPLDSTDLRVLQGLIALATAGLRNIRRLLRDGQSLRTSLDLKGDAQDERTVAARFTLASLADMAGFDRGGFGCRQMRASLQRLSNVTVLVDRPEFEGAFRLVSGYRLDKHTGELVVSISPLGTTAILGRQGYLRLNMDEVRRIHGEVAHLIHSRLHWVNQGDRRPVNMDTLCSYAYVGVRTGSALRKRRMAVRQALKELMDVGWTVTEKYPGTYLIGRPRRASDQGELVTRAGVNW